MGKGNNNVAIKVDEVPKFEVEKLENIEKCAEIAKMVAPAVISALTSLLPGGIVPPVVVTAISVGAKITAKVIIDKAKEFFIDLSDGEINGLYEGVNIRNFNKTSSLVEKIKKALKDNYKPIERNESMVPSNA